MSEQQGPDDLLGGLGNLLGGMGQGGGGGLGDLLAQAQAAMSASAQAGSTEVEGSAGGGVVKIVGTGAGEVRSVTISPVVVDPNDVETLEDLVLAALRDLNSNIADLHSAAVGGMDPSSMLGGLFGGDGDDDDDDDLLELDVVDDDE